MLALCATSALADVIVLQDGARVEGPIKSCDDESCTTGSGRIPLAGMARIELRGAVKMPSEVPAPGVVLTDGTVRKGRFEGLNRGYVWIGGEEIDRASVAVIVITASQAADLLVGPQGTRAGSLESCNAAGCVFSARTIPWAAIRWVGLHQEGNTPPGAGGRDEVHFRDREPVEAVVTGLDARSVRTTRGTFDRAAVSWISRAPAPASPSPASGPPVVRPAPPPPAPALRPSQQPVSAPPTLPPVSSPGRPTPSTAGSPSELPKTGCGALWEGRMSAVNRVTHWTVFNMTVQVRLRAVCPDIPLLAVAGAVEVLELVSEGSTIRTVITSTGHSCVSSGIGTERISGTVGYLSRRIESIGSRGEVRWSPWQYELSFPHEDLEWQDRCPAGGEHTPAQTSRFRGGQAAHTKPLAGGDSARFVENGRMFGSWEDEGGHAQWSICQAGSVCPPPTDPPVDQPRVPPEVAGDDPPDCSRLAQLLGRMRALRDLAAGYRRDLTNALRSRDAARDAIWGADGALKNYFTSMLKLAGQGASAALSNAIGYATTLLGMSGEGNVSDVNKAVKQLGYGPQDLLMGAAEKQGLRNAVRAADAYLKQTGDHQGALRVYAGSVERSENLRAAGKKMTKGVGFVTATADYATKTNELFNLIDAYGDANEEANRAQTNIDDVDEKIAALQRQIDEVRSQIDEEDCPPGAARRRDRAPAFQPVAMQHPFLAVQAAPAAPPDTSAVQEKLNRQAERLAQVEALFESANLWLMPFALEVTEDIDPALLAAMLQRAQPQLEQIRTLIEEAVREGERIEAEIKAAVPQTPGAKS